MKEASLVKRSCWSKLDMLRQSRVFIHGQAVNEDRVRRPKPTLWPVLRFQYAVCQEFHGSTFSTLALCNA